MSAPDTKKATVNTKQSGVNAKAVVKELRQDAVDRFEKFEGYHGGLPAKVRVRVRVKVRVRVRVS